MKKLSSFFVLMLIALMLFVSCNGSTPTKEESNSSSNGSTPTVTERAATDADYTLFATLSNVLMNDIVSNRIHNSELIPEGCKREQDDSTNTISLTFNSCEFDSYNLDGSPLHVKLNGNATIRTEGEQENSVTYITCNFTEGSSLGDTDFTTNLEFDTNNAEMGYNFTSAIINGNKVKGLSELAKSKAIRVATDEDKELTKKLIAVFDYIKTLTPQQISELNTSKKLIINDNSTHVVYAFNNLDFEYSGTNYLLNGGVEVITKELYKKYDIKCNFFNTGTKIDGIYHSVVAEGTQTYTNNNSTFNFQKAIIDYTLITNLVVEVPERVATDADGKLISAIYIATKDLFNNSNPPANVDFSDNNNLTFNGYSFSVRIGESEVFNLILVGSATKTEKDGNIKYEYDLKDGTTISVRDLKDSTTISDVPHTVNASFTKNNTIEVLDAIIDGTKVKNLGDKMKPYL